LSGSGSVPKRGDPYTIYLVEPNLPGVADVAGEARTVQAVRSRLIRERGRPRRSVISKPFWTPGKKGME
jgi:NADPH-dependent ferric siderophore reductase